MEIARIFLFFFEGILNKYEDFSGGRLNIKRSCTIELRCRLESGGEGATRENLINIAKKVDLSLEHLH